MFIINNQRLQLIHGSDRINRCCRGGWVDIYCLYLKRVLPPRSRNGDEKLSLINLGLARDLSSMTANISRFIFIAANVCNSICSFFTFMHNTPRAANLRKTPLWPLNESQVAAKVKFKYAIKSGRNHLLERSSGSKHWPRGGRLH